jgi:predicted nucleic acid-binding protein
MPVHDYLIETTVLVDMLRDHAQAIAWVNSLPSQRRWVSVVTYFELLAGCRNRREQRIVAREMRNYHLLFLTEDISRTALSWYTRFHLSHGVGFLDTLLGATAFHHDLTLATLNTKHFAPLPGLQVECPY